jgi:hypothetical protein
MRPREQAAQPRAQRMARPVCKGFSELG